LKVNVGCAPKIKIMYDHRVASLISPDRSRILVRLAIKSRQSVIANRGTINLRLETKGDYLVPAFLFLQVKPTSIFFCFKVSHKRHFILQKKYCNSRNKRV